MGNSVVPTAQAGDASNRSASTAFVTAAIAAAIAGIPSSPVYVPSGSVVLFFQASAPTGYTQVVTQNDKALRVVSGTGGGTGGSTAFSTVFSQSATGATTLSTSTVPHGTYTSNYNGGSGNGTAPFTAVSDAAGDGVMSSSAGSISTSVVTDGNSGGSHTHPISLQLQYIDIILCSKT